jgi:hypothetical protein
MVRPPCIGILLAGVFAASVAAQQAPATTGPQAPGVSRADAPLAQEPQLPPLGVSPRGAFLRAMLLPGWGHVAIGSYTRGGFYFGLEAATAYTFIRTRSRLSDARERAMLRESVVRARLADTGITDLAAIEAGIDADETLQGLRNLVSSREGQQEDLVAWSIFLVLLTGADAYVSAHLSRFPTPIVMEAAASPDGRAEVSFTIPFP